MKRMVSWEGNGWDGEEKEWKGRTKRKKGVEKNKEVGEEEDEEEAEEEEWRDTSLTLREEVGEGERGGDEEGDEEGREEGMEENEEEDEEERRNKVPKNIPQLLYRKTKSKNPNQTSFFPTYLVVSQFRTWFRTLQRGHRGRCLCHMLLS